MIISYIRYLKSTYILNYTNAKFSDKIELLHYFKELTNFSKKIEVFLFSYVRTEFI